MPFINGQFKRGYNWVADQAAGIFNLATRQQADAEDIASGLSVTMLRDGTSTATSDLPMGNHSLIGLRQAAAAGEPMEFAQANALIAAAGGSSYNALQNGSFLINQRNLSGTITLAAAAYGHDRWKAGASGAAYAISAVSSNNQATIGSGSLQQVVAGSDITIATMTLSNQGTAQARVYPQGSAQPSFAACPITVTNLTPGMPAIVEFSTGTVLQPQLEAGATAHSFAKRSVVTELLLCQAYYENVPFAASTISGGSSRWLVRWRVPKVIVPNVTLTNQSDPTGGNTLSTDHVSSDGCALFDQASGSSAFAQVNIIASAEP